jgi:hypothetical protein
MGRAFGFVTVLATVAIGFYLYSRQVQSLVPGSGNPHTAVDITAVRNDLIGIANAERRHWAANARYASLEELRANGDPLPSRAAYSYSAEASETSFKVIATYTGADPAAPRRVSIDDSMTIVME